MLKIIKGMRELDKEEMENRIARVNATMAMEGMPLTEEEKDVLRDIYLGKISYEEVISELIEKYTES